MNAVNTLDYYRNQLGSVDAYLGKFQDVAYYRGSPCFSAAGCSDAERAAMERNRSLASESLKKANDALFKGLEQQQRNLTADARQLERLQSAAQGATGQMQAIGFANQLAANQANQLLQIRGLLIAQQSTATARMQAQADLEAQQQAAGATSREPRIERTAIPKNWLELTVANCPETRPVRLFAIASSVSFLPIAHLTLICLARLIQMRPQRARL